MPVFHSRTIRGKAVSSKQMTGCGVGSFLLGNTLGGLQEVDRLPSALSGNGLGMGMPSSITARPMTPFLMQKSAPSGMGLSSINKKLESLMVKASKAKPKSIRFNM